MNLRNGSPMADDLHKLRQGHPTGIAKRLECGASRRFWSRLRPRVPLAVHFFRPRVLASRSPACPSRRPIDEQNTYFV